MLKANPDAEAEERKGGGERMRAPKMENGRG